MEEIRFREGNRRRSLELIFQAFFDTIKGQMTNYYNVGKIVNTQGLQGEVRILPVTDFAEERFKKGVSLALFDNKNQFVRELTVKSARPYKTLYIAKFAGLDSINDVEIYKNFTLKIAEENLSALTEGEFYYHEIIGIDVYENDEKIGSVSEILQPGANDVWVVARPDKKDLLLPYIPNVVLSVDVAGQRINVEIPDGLDD